MTFTALIARTNLALGLSMAAVLAVAAWVGGDNLPLALGYHRAPDVLAPATVASASGLDALPGSLVQLTVENSSMVGEQKSTRNGKPGPVTARYFVTRVSDRALLIKSPPGASESDRTFRGALRPIPSEEFSNLLAPILPESPGLKAALLPFELDATRDGGPEALIVLACLAAAVLAIYKITRLLERRADITRHPSVRELSRYGSPGEVLQRIDGELEASGGGTRVGPVRLTDHWLVWGTPFQVKAIEWNDLVWLYKKVIKKSTYFIPTGRDFQAVLMDRHSATLEIQTRQKHVDRLLEVAAARCPWAMQGYSDRLAAQMRGSEQAQIIAEVIKRRDLQGTG